MRRLGALLSVGVVLGACGADPPDPPAREVRFQAEDGVELAGDVRGSGRRGVLLVHAFGSDRTSWGDLPADLAEEGSLVLTFDLRGFGDSEGRRDAAATPEDVVGAVEALRAEGAEAVVLVGAGAGGTASLVASAGPDVAVDGVVTLSAPGSFLGLVASGDVVASVEEPKLFIAGDREATSATALTLFEAASPPKRLELVAGAEHGTELLEGQRGSSVRNLIREFLARHG